MPLGANDCYGYYNGGRSTPRSISYSKVRSEVWVLIVIVSKTIED